MPPLSTARLHLGSASFAGPTNVRVIVEQVGGDVFRTDFSAPGFALLDLGLDLTPRDFRARLIRLGEAMAACYEERFGGSLVFVTAGRFDQQAPTRPHRDGGPDASILLLGYEPTEVPSRIFLLDFSRCAFDRGQSPREFLDCCNPAFPIGEELLRDYTTETVFAPEHYQILLVNNSVLPWEERERGMLGVLHHAVITPRPGRARPIDSVQMGIGSAGVSEEELRAFIEGAAV
jgi:hypothetical protein